MNGLDIILINVISYLGGILSGIYIHHKMNKNKKSYKEKDKDKDIDIIDKYSSPIISATPAPILPDPIPSAPPYQNPNLNKRIVITTE